MNRVRWVLLSPLLLLLPLLTACDPVAISLQPLRAASGDAGQARVSAAP
ncbi:hypothetical protein J7U46_20550 [Pelomonas sp. V22]|nr:hypothetical protein [Pelomonas sp. V22]MDI4635466.1 hypothetical protein [Pelomonas sp. V22]